MSRNLRSESSTTITAPLVITYPWKSPPLRSNDRKNWRVEAADKRVAKYTAFTVVRNLMRQGKVRPISTPVTATIIWTVTDRRRRDAGASSPTLKVCLDAAVGAGLLTDDRHEIVVEERCRIEHGAAVGVRIELEAA